MKKALISATLLSLTSFAALSENTIKTYDVKYGFAGTFSVSQTEQLGEFQVVLKNNKRSKHHRGKLLVLDGSIKGVLNPDFTLTHTFVNKDRSGVLYTANDSITNILSGDPTCESGTGSTPFKVEEVLNIVAGTGIYANVEAGSFIVLKGTINNCPSLSGYGKNTFRVMSGTVTFTE